MKTKNPLYYRLSQFISFLLGIRVFVLLLLVLALYVSTFFLFNQEESLRRFVFDYKVHGIILCSVLSIAAGGLINQFYDLEKDKIQRPFRARIQSFLKTKYFLYSYLILNIISLGIAWALSPRIFVFFFIYQFTMWLYSHKLSKIAFVNNFTFVVLTLYPFFGMLVYYQHFSWPLFWMAAFLFFILLIIDNIKDILTIRPDRIFGYRTIATDFSVKFSVTYISILLVICSMVALVIAFYMPQFNLLSIYFVLSAIVLTLALYPMIYFRIGRMFWLMNLLRFWIFIGVIFMLLNGIFERF